MPLGSRAQDADNGREWQWGPEHNGVSLALQLDKEVYQVGEPIRLDIAREVRATPQPIYMGLCDSVTIELRDANGSRVASFSSVPICIGSYTSNRPPFPTDRIVHTTVRLTREPFESGSSTDLGNLPIFAGRYSLIVKWVFASKDWPGEVCSSTCSAIVYSDAVPFRIDDNGKQIAPSPWATAPTSAGSSGSFAQVETSLGPATALEDKATSLKWLHLDLTATMSVPEVIAAMKPGGWLAGWWFATPDELRRLFVDYTGSPDGISQNPDLAARMQSDLGGPIQGSSQASKNGYVRTSSIAFLPLPCEIGNAQGYSLFGIMMNDNIVGASLDPNLQGCAITTGASWLVQ